MVVIVGLTMLSSHHGFPRASGARAGDLQERNAIVQTSQRPSFMRNQKRMYTPVVAAYADSYPELHFAALLRDDFQKNNNPRYAFVTTELMIATGRAIESRLKQQAQEPAPEESPEV